MRDSTPRVSVLLPVRNGGDGLAVSIASIVNQTLTDWELLLIDDGSTDGAIERLPDKMAADSRVQVLTNTGCGLPEALNTGLAYARAPLIARMDADDTSHPERLSIQCHTLDSHPEWGLVACRVRHRMHHGQSQQGYRLYVDWINSLIDPDSIRQNRFIESPIAHPSVVFRRDAVTRYGGYRRGDFPEDYELWLRWMDNGVLMGKCPETLLDWNDHPERLSRNHSAYRPDAFYKIKAQYLARWLDTHCAHKRDLWIWGAGRLSRKRARYLETYGLTPSGYIDIDPAKIGNSIQGRPVVEPDQFPSGGFILVYVASRGARDAIREWLDQHDLHPEIDYLFAA